MKLSTVLTACDIKYSRFIPIFIKSWQYFYPSVKIVIVFIGNLPEHYNEYRDQIIEFSPPTGLPTSYVAQTIRLLWPALLGEKGGVLITDIDMIPGNNKYFTDSISSYPDEIFINYRQGNGITDQIYMCYNVAPSHVWGELFHIYNRDDIDKFLVQNFNCEYDSQHGGKGWFTDQELFYKYFMKWKNFNPESWVFLTDEQTHFQRFDFPKYAYSDILFIRNLKSRRFADCHLYSHECPYSEKELLELIVLLVDSMAA
jgi:hypothetical protein